MLTLQSIFASGWIQIVILLGIFTIFSRWVLENKFKYGYGLGWLIGIFLIVGYGALYPRTPIQVAAESPTQLSFASVFLSSCAGVTVATIIVGVTFVLRGAWFRQMFAISGITAFLIMMLFVMIMSNTQTKMALTLASLAFTIIVTATYVFRRAYLSRELIEPLDEPIEQPQGSERIELIREQATTAHRL